MVVGVEPSELPSNEMSSPSLKGFSYRLETVRDIVDKFKYQISNWTRIQRFCSLPVHTNYLGDRQRYRFWGPTADQVNKNLGVGLKTIVSNDISAL